MNFYFMPKYFTVLLVLFTTNVLAQECVVLLHGLARSSSSMNPMEKRLLQENYEVINLDYPSRDFPIEALAPMVIEKGLASCSDHQPIHFVTHSMGGILVRQYLSTNPINHLGKVVMLGPPNKGSEVVDKLRKVPGFGFINGPAGYQLGTQSDSLPLTIGSSEMTLGIIAGNKSINLLLSLLIPGPDDGKVSVNSTRLSSADDFKQLPVSHPFLPSNDEVIEHVVYFLKHGRFPLKHN